MTRLFARRRRCPGRAPGTRRRRLRRSRRRASRRGSRGPSRGRRVAAGFHRGRSRSRSPGIHRCRLPMRSVYHAGLVSATAQVTRSMNFRMGFSISLSARRRFLVPEWSRGCQGSGCQATTPVGRPPVGSSWWRRSRPGRSAAARRRRRTRYASRRATIPGPCRRTRHGDRPVRIPRRSGAIGTLGRSGPQFAGLGVRCPSTTVKAIWEPWGTTPAGRGSQRAVRLRVASGPSRPRPWCGRTSPAPHGRRRQCGSRPVTRTGSRGRSATRRQSGSVRSVEVIV